MVSKSQLKYIQSLGQKKYRDTEGVFVAEGPKLVKELIQGKNVELSQIFALNEWIRENNDLLESVNVTPINEIELQRISQLTTPNKVIAVVKKFEAIEPIIKERISLVLDAIRDPGNLGTIIRIADWFGISQVICSDDCADIYNPKVVQATMGSIARVRVFYTVLPGWLKQQTGTRIYAAMLEGRDVTKMSVIKEGLIIIGNESSGIDEELQQCANEKISIPRKGNAESLNAAVATGIILSHLV
ncbi:MAG TPA: RNA methyltransferase [Chitinophagaceae bacterium]|jgi:TrmH family RNA methyltransferase|nr:RNA methyltransferase [Chitinophagaceae bacterium]